MKSFKEFLVEAPLPSEADVTKFKVDPNAEDPFVQLKNVFDKYIEKKRLGKYIDEGISRFVFRVTVEDEKFDKDMIKVLGASTRTGKHNTVIKLAKDDSGILQNAIELDLWNKTKSKWLCPIIDTYTNIIKSKAKDIKKFKVAEMFIQMPLCITDEKRVDKLLLKTFGKLKKNASSFDVDRLNTGGVRQINLYDIESKEFIENRKKFGTTEEQEKNLLEFASFLHENKMTDFKVQNFGIYKEKLVIIDYGLDTDRGAKSFFFGKAIKIKLGKDGTVFWKL